MPETSILTVVYQSVYISHHPMPSPLKPEIAVADVCERLVGITPVYLQNFLQRGSYGVRSSVSPGKVRSQRRLFSVEDVYGIALVWELFESGLRGDTIARILKDVAGTKKADANRAAVRLLENKSAYLLISRTARRPSKSIPKMPIQSVEALTEEEFARVLQKWPRQSGQVIAVGEKFADVRKRLEILFDVR
jgi:hypothetical protein